MLALCKNCMDSIKIKKGVVDRLREETEANMIASAGRLDDHIRRVTRTLDSLTRMHMNESNEAAERLGKLLDIDIDAEEKMEDFRRLLLLLEYRRREREPILYRAYVYICAVMQWLTLKFGQLVQLIRLVVRSFMKEMHEQDTAAAEAQLASPNPQTVSPASPMSPWALEQAKSDETDVSLRQKVEETGTPKPKVKNK